MFLSNFLNALPTLLYIIISASAVGYVAYDHGVKKGKDMGPLNMFSLPGSHANPCRFRSWDTEKRNYCAMECLLDINKTYHMEPGGTLESLDFVLELSGDGPLSHEDPIDRPWYHCRRLIRSVVLRPGITAISSETFCDMPALTSVYIPSTVKRIDPCAFYNCPSLRSVGIPADAVVAKDAFYFSDHLYPGLEPTVCKIEENI